MNKIKTDKIKISHINPTDTRGGASLAGYRLHKELLKNPRIDSALFVHQKFSQDKEVIRFSNLFLRVCQKMISFFDYLTGLQYLFNVNWLGLLFFKRFWQTDIFVLRMAHGGYLPLWLPWLLGKIAPVIWRMPDLWAFTPRCPYSYDCGKDEYPEVFIKSDKTLFNLKKFFYSRANVFVVCPSRWLEQEVKKSGFFSESRIFYIPTGVDVEVFKPALKTEKPSVIAVSVELSDKRKGGEIMPEILRKLNKILKEKNIFIDFYWAGNRYFDISIFRNVDMSNINNIFLGYLTEKELAEYYAKSHIYILPALADNLPNTLLEALSSGTPAICFDVGGCKDAVKHMETGYLAKPFDIDDFVRGIFYVLENYQRMGRNGRKLILDNFIMEHQAKEYLKLIKSIEKPKISIITIVLNNRNFLERTIKSVLQQDYQNIEYIVIDGGSTDGSIDIIKKYQRQIVYWTSGQDKGLYDAMNIGIRQARGDWLLILNSGDYLADKGALSRTAESIENRPGKFYYFTMAHQYADGKRKIYKHRIFWWNRFLIWYSAYIPHMTLLVHKADYEKIGLYDIGFQIAADHDFILRLIRVGIKPVFKNTLLSVMQMGGISSRDPEKTFRDFRDVTIKNGCPKWLAELIYKFKIWKIKIARSNLPILK